MTFPARLTELIEKATKRPWLARPEYGCRNPEHWEVAPDRVCKVGVPAEIARVWNYEEKDQPNAELIAYLVNHAEAIRDLVVAAELLHDNLAEYQRINNIGGYDNQDMRMVREALAKLKEPA